MYICADVRFHGFQLGMHFTMGREFVMKGSCFADSGFFQTFMNQFLFDMTS